MNRILDRVFSERFRFSATLICKICRPFELFVSSTTELYTGKLCGTDIHSVGDVKKNCINMFFMLGPDLLQNTFSSAGIGHELEN